MDLNILENIVRIAEQSSLSVLEVESEGLRVRVEKPAVGMAVPKQTITYVPASAPIAPPVQREPEKAASEPPAEAEKQVPAGTKELRSPMVGTFHFVKGKESLIGKKLKKGESACIIEAMKLMNEIAMEEDGEIAWVAVAPGDMVEYGQLLLTFN